MTSLDYQDQQTVCSPISQGDTVLWFTLLKKLLSFKSIVEPRHHETVPWMLLVATDYLFP